MKKEGILLSRASAIDKIVDFRSVMQFGKMTKKWTTQKVFEHKLKQNLQSKSNEDLSKAFHKAFPELRQFIQPELKL